MGNNWPFKMLRASLLLSGFLTVIYAFPMDIRTFHNFIEPRCYNHTAPNVKEIFINGQEYPLANTLENFLALLEKLEAANPEMTLKDELDFLLRNFTIENIVYTGEYADEDYPRSFDSSAVHSLWETGNAATTTIENPFDDSEICSLYYMLSHTVNDTATEREEPGRAYQHQNDAGVYRANVVKTKIPREQGVVAIKRTNHSVALGRVLLGLHLGVLQIAEKKLSELLPPSKLQLLDTEKNIDQTLKEAPVKPLYILTLADSFVGAKWRGVSQEVGRNGIWRYEYNHFSPKSEVTVCPTVYELPENNTAQSTFSLVRGGVDGLILGSIISQVQRSIGVGKVRLSQILRMYYSPDGVTLKSSATDAPQKATFCKREEIIDKFFKETFRQQINMLYLIGEKDYTAYARITEMIYGEFERTKEQIFNLQIDGLSEYCESSISNSSSGNPTYSCETELDVIVALDTTAFVERQQQIVGYFANELDLWFNGSKITVLSDRLNDSDTSRLKEIVPQTFSSACVACRVTQEPPDLLNKGSEASPETRVKAINELLDRKKAEEASLSGTTGKVVVYFNFKEQEQETPGLASQLQILLASRHQDVRVFGLGRNDKILRRYVKDDYILADVEDVKLLAQNLTKQMCRVPSSLQYSGCKLGTEEDKATYKGLVSPHAIQRWAMDAKYFEKSLDPKVYFKPKGDSDIVVCYNRANSTPEVYYGTNCKSTGVGNRVVTIAVPNPCQGFTVHSCPSFFFSVIGLENRDNSYCVSDQDVHCKTLDQISFEVSHTGIRCNGCSTLVSLPAVLIASLIAYFILKMNH